MSTPPSAVDVERLLPRLGKIQLLVGLTGLTLGSVVLGLIAATVIGMRNFWLLTFGLTVASLLLASFSALLAVWSWRLRQVLTTSRPMSIDCELSSCPLGIGHLWISLLVDQDTPATHGYGSIAMHHHDAPPHRFAVAASILRDAADVFQARAEHGHGDD